MSDVPRPDTPAETGNLRWWIRLMDLENKQAEIHTSFTELLNTNVTLWQANEHLQTEREKLTRRSDARFDAMEARITTLEMILDRVMDDGWVIMSPQMTSAPLDHWCQVHCWTSPCEHNGATWCEDDATWKFP